MDEIILDQAHDGKTGKPILILDGDRTRTCGILHCSHEFSVAVEPHILDFLWADSIDVGETNSYKTEEDFESRYPGVMAAIRQAREWGRLYVYKYTWDKAKRTNFREPIPYDEYIKDAE